MKLNALNLYSEKIKAFISQSARIECTINYTELIRLENPKMVLKAAFNPVPTG